MKSKSGFPGKAWAQVAILLICSVSSAFAQNIHSSLSLDTAIDTAIAMDPWLRGSNYRQTALNSESASTATLPDPKISLMAANFPTDTFDIDQEAMTQLIVGISQMFPRGDSLQLSSRQKRQMAAQEPLLRQERTAKVTATISQLWLDAYKAQESIRLIELDRALFEHLVDATRTSYSVALGQSRQQDIIRAQLELTRLDDRLTVMRQQFEVAQLGLSEWIGDMASLPVTGALPDAGSSESLLQLMDHVGNQEWLYQQISRHPMLHAYDQRIQAMQTGIELAHQKYKPEWGLSAQYGYRADDTLGRDRADLFSVGVTFDLPVFTDNRQDQEVHAATAKTEELKSAKLLVARQMMTRLETASTNLQRLNQRRALYNKQLLPQMAEQAEAALVAYNNDDGDFAEAVRARIAELNAKIEALGIAVKRQQTLAMIDYLLTQSPSDTERHD